MLDPIEPVPETRKIGHRFVDLALSISAICVSLASMYLAQQSSGSMERLVQANSMPFVQLESGNATDEGRTGVLGFTVRNAGTGPARIHSFNFLVDGEVIPNRGFVTRNVALACCATEWETALAASDGDISRTLGNDLTSPVANTFLSPHDSTGAWQWERSDHNTSLWRAIDLARQEGRIGMRACYCSLFDDCWVAQTGVFPPTPVESCEAPRQSLSP